MENNLQSSKTIQNKYQKQKTVELQTSWYFQWNSGRSQSRVTRRSKIIYSRIAEKIKKKSKQKKQENTIKNETTQTFQKLEEARKRIMQIIQEFYEGKACFEDYKEQIQDSVSLVYNNQFRDYLDQLIRMRVGYIQRSIWDYTQSILEDNPFDRQEDHSFYPQMVDYLFSVYEDIQRSSAQIQKIINIYLRYAYMKSQSRQEIVYSNLAINTFNYMVDNDQSLKVNHSHTGTFNKIQNLIKICDKKISPRKLPQRHKLDELIQLIQGFDDNHYQNYQIDTACTEDIGSQQDHEEKKKKKKKIKENDLIVDEQLTMSRFQKSFNQFRSPCRVTDQWLKKIKNKLNQFKKT